MNSHDITVTVELGRIVLAACSCGEWSEHVAFARPTGERVAFRLAYIMAGMHRKEHGLPSVTMK